MTRIGPYEALGVRVTIDAPDPVADVLVEALTDLAAQAGDPGHAVVVRADGDATFAVTVDGEQRVGLLGLGATIHYTLVVLNEFAARHAVADSVVLHAGVVAFGGRAVAIVGTSGAGKTTLTAACLLAGASLVAEEVCAVDDHGTVWPYHRPLGLRPGGARALGLAVRPLAADLPVPPVRAPEISSLAGPTTLAGVMLVHRRPGALELVPLAPVDALVRLSGQTLGDGGCERQMFRRLDQFVRRHPVWAAAYDVTEDAVATVRRIADPVSGTLVSG